MITAGDFRKGITFEINGEPYVILDFQHVKPGKGAAFVRTKYKNIITGATREEAFNPSDKFENARIDTMKYLRENDEATIKFYNEKPFLVEAPNFVNLTVIETEPGVKGDTATNVTKAATVETGAVIQVPIFINEGEKIQIDTRSGEYLGRAK
mgnify:CR=1 FL=1